MARIYMDEDILDPRLAEKLREKGHDVLTAKESGNINKGQSDADQLNIAAENDRTIITNNRRHFNREHLESSGHKGIISGNHEKDLDKFAGQVDAIVKNNNLENVNVRANTNDFVAENKAGEKKTYTYDQPKIDPGHIRQSQSKTGSNTEPPEPTKPGASQPPPNASQKSEPDWKAKWRQHSEETKIPPPPPPPPADMQSQSKGRSR